MKQSKRTFGYHLDISSELVVIDARYPSGVDMSTLKKVLRQTSNEIKVGIRLSDRETNLHSVLGIKLT